MAGAVTRIHPRRNAGRRAELEVDDAELGAQAQALDYPFLGADYDHNDGRIGIMLGEPGRAVRHLTHSVGSLTSVDILQRPDGSDSALRIPHTGGQTLLTFIP